ncbi:hypothetical protein R1sor_025448 [Riccia sorocarpa]|uniref:Uncharacterized protein n=1 Tax=Riccia sorocarpa TaxID=122646 RepID=A0ABD3GBQ8_9MARC
MTSNRSDDGDHCNVDEWEKPKWKSSGRSHRSNSPLQDLSPRELSRRVSQSSCCKTHADFPEAEQMLGGNAEDDLPPECNSSSKAVKPVSAEYGYQAKWRSSRAPVKVKDIIEPCTVCPSTSQFKPCQKYIPAGTGAWSEKWKASKRYIDPGLGEAKEWRPSVRTFEPKLGVEVEHRPHVKSDRGNMTLETNEPSFRPGRRSLLPYTPLKREEPYPHKRYIQVVPEWIPPFRVAGEDYNTAPPKKREGNKAPVPEYHERHPPISLAWEVSNLPGRPSTASSRPARILTLGAPPPEGSANITPYAYGIIPTDEGARSLRKYVPEGHLSHFEGNVCCVCKPGTMEKKTLKGRRAMGPYYETAQERNLISGLLPPTDVYRPTKVTPGPQLYGPAGTLNSDVIGHCFSDLKRVGTPLSEMRDQYRIPDLPKEIVR